MQKTGPGPDGEANTEDDIEQCDDGNRVDDDACTNACTIPRCGDNVTTPFGLNGADDPDNVPNDDEECDDGDAGNRAGPHADLALTWCSFSCKRPECSNGRDQAVGEVVDDVDIDANDGGCYSIICDRNSRYLAGKGNEDNGCALPPLAFEYGDGSATDDGGSENPSPGETQASLLAQVQVIPEGQEGAGGPLPCDKPAGVPQPGQGGCDAAHVCRLPFPTAENGVCKPLKPEHAGCLSNWDCAGYYNKTAICLSTGPGGGFCTSGRAEGDPPAAGGGGGGLPIFPLCALVPVVGGGGGCGDGNVDPGEACDDKNRVDNDACNNACQVVIGGLCDPNACANGGDANCAADGGKICQPAANLPCVKCVAPVGGVCNGTECANGGTATCAKDGMECSLTGNSPCVTCIPPNSCGNGIIDALNPTDIDDGCAIKGAGGHLCVPAGAAPPVGDFGPEHPCYQGEHCQNTNGQCAWVMTSELQSCLDRMRAAATPPFPFVATVPPPVPALPAEPATPPFLAQVAGGGACNPYICSDGRTYATCDGRGNPITYDGNPCDTPSGGQCPGDIRRCCDVGGVLKGWSNRVGAACTFEACPAGSSHTQCDAETDSCIRGGCFGELCMPNADFFDPPTHCQFTQDVMCYNSGICEWTGSACAWRQTDQLQKCLNDNTGPKKCPSGQSCLTRAECKGPAGIVGNACGANNENVCCTVTDEPFEDCDDGNRIDNDKCDNTCKINCSTDAECPEGACVEGKCVDVCKEVAADAPPAVARDPTPVEDFFQSLKEMLDSVGRFSFIETAYAACGDGVCQMPEEIVLQNFCAADCQNAPGWCGNNMCEPAIGEFNAAEIPRGYCANDCYCGNGTCDTPTNLEHFIPELREGMKESAANCPADCAAPVGPDEPEDDDPPVVCVAPHAECGLNAVGGAEDQCTKAGKVVEWAPGNPACSLPNGAPGICYRCVAAQCPAGFSCGTVNGPRAASCPPGEKVDWNAAGILCGDEGGRCFECVANDDDDNDDDEEGEPVQCNQTCTVDADCAGAEQCDRDAQDPTKDGCWMENNVCVKKCVKPRCIDNLCALAAPTDTPTAPFTPCEGVASCPAARCGDGIVQPPPASGDAEAGEECDDGNAVANDGCTASCKKEVCGDGIIHPKGADGLPNTSDDETCDDGNRAQGDGCSPSCKVEKCGNGVREYGEECDNGAANSDTDPGACRTSCKLAKCNDGVVDYWPGAGLNEQCDCGPAFAGYDFAANPTNYVEHYCKTIVDGQPANCHIGNCQASFCGNGTVNNHGLDNLSGTADDEMCDAGPMNTNQGEEGKCDNDAQCDDNTICVDSECKAVGCNADADCPHGKCIEHMCRAGGCTVSSDCRKGATCVANSCSQCSNDSECLEGNCHNGICIAPSLLENPLSACRLDCKMARCGDGIVDEAAGETCDEGQAMFKCAAPPYESCSCGIPTWGSHTRPNGSPLDQTCCSAGTSVVCRVAATATCPSNCGVTNGVCGNARLEATEECDVTESVELFVFRPNRDGTKLSFVEDNGRWTVVPPSIEKKYTSIDHVPTENSSPDNAYLRSNGAAVTYFHLWDLPTSQGRTSLVTVRVGVDFTGNGAGWKVQETALASFNNVPILIADINAAILKVTGDETRHELKFALYDPSSGRQLTKEATIVSSVTVAGSSRIDVDAIDITVLGTDIDPTACSASCSVKRCGNGGPLDAGEQCDDSNAESGDGCTDKCFLEICALPA